MILINNNNDNYNDDYDDDDVGKDNNDEKNYDDNHDGKLGPYLWKTFLALKLTCKYLNNNSYIEVCTHR